MGGELKNAKIQSRNKRNSRKYIEVEADSEADAKVSVRSGEGESAGIKFLENMPIDKWTVEEL